MVLWNALMDNKVREECLDIQFHWHQQRFRILWWPAAFCIISCSMTNYLREPTRQITSNKQPGGVHPSGSSRQHLSKLIKFRTHYATTTLNKQYPCNGQESLSFELWNLNVNRDILRQTDWEKNVFISCPNSWKIWLTRWLTRCGRTCSRRDLEARPIGPGRLN